MGTLIDSSVLVAAERGKLDLKAKLSSLGEEPIAVAAITASELLHGVHRASSSTQRSVREAFVEQLLSNVEVVAFDLVAARIHARLAAELYRTPVGAHDLIIGASALALGFQVATRDLRSFPKIPGLAVVHW
ncbi:MAG TPA: PIN domain-containing protein [Polyangiaceae bacterium]|jgi:predicted nucleic acid-binding protein|nr:PIN domain-containing protein [Polyangiaceae bacterium]